MKINTFYTWCWFIWFTLCLAFYHSINFDYIDECLTLFMILMTLWKLEILKNRKAKKELAYYWGIMMFYLVYSIVMGVNETAAAFRDLQQQMRPYMVFYCSWVLAPQFTPKQEKWILRAMLGSLFVVLFLLFRGSGAAAFSQENSPVIGQMACVAAMTYYIFKPQTKKHMMYAMLIMSTGLITGKSKFFGEYIAFIGIFMMVQRKIQLFTPRRLLQLTLLTTTIIYFTWTKFNAYYVEGMEEDLSGYDRKARPESYKAAGTIIFHDYIPFGSGLGTFATDAAAKYYSPLYYKYDLSEIWGLTPDQPMFLADAFYPTIAEFGLFGLLLFLVFWRRRWVDIQKILDVRYYKVAIMASLALLLESVADTSYLSGKGMGYFMLLGICLSRLQYQKKED